MRYENCIQKIEDLKTNKTNEVVKKVKRKSYSFNGKIVKDHNEQDTVLFSENGKYYAKMNTNYKLFNGLNGNYVETSKQSAIMKGSETYHFIEIDKQSFLLYLTYLKDHQNSHALNQAQLACSELQYKNKYVTINSDGTAKVYSI